MLSAGLGRRLQPLSLFVPKPLLPVDGEPVVGHTLRQLGRLRCEAAALNLHHLPEAIPRHLGASYHGLPLVYSREEEIQGTLGALYLERSFLAAADLVLLVNGDTLCAWPWKRLIRRHLRSGAEATLLVHSRPPDPDLGGGVGLDGGRVVALRDARVGAAKSRHLFAGAHVLSPRLLARLVPGPGDVVGDLYVPLLAEGGRIEAVVTRRPWHDLGTPERYLAANLDRLRRRWRRGRPSRISPLARIHSTATVEGSLVDRGVVVGEGAHVASSVVLAGAAVPAGSRIEWSILGPGVRLPSAAGIERRMVNRTRPGHPTGPRESVMGELVYTPLELAE